MRNVYKLVTSKLGCEVQGIYLQTEARQEVLKKLKDEISKHRMLIFRDQGLLDAGKQVEITKWLGAVDPPLLRHPKSPHPDVLRISNDPSEGCVSASGGGWQVDGSYRPKPSAYAVYHVVEVPSEGPSYFAPLTELLERLPKSKSDEWNRLWMVSDVGSRPIHPLVYKHPLTRKQVMCFDLSKISGFIYDMMTDHQRFASAEETLRLRSEILEEFERDEGSVQYRHDWEEGDLIVLDNLSVAHNAASESPAPGERPTLKVLHKTQVRGSHAPLHETMEIPYDLAHALNS